MRRGNGFNLLRRRREDTSDLTTSLDIRMGTGTTCAQNWGQAPAGVLRIGDRHRLVFQLVLNTRWE